MSRCLASLVVIFVLWPSPVLADWSSARHDAANTNRLTEQPTLPLLEVGTVHNHYFSPIMSGNYLIAAEPELFGQQLIAYELPSLKPRWRRSIGWFFPQSPVIDQGVLYLASAIHPKVIAINLIDGQELWQARLPTEAGGARTRPLVIEHSLYVPSGQLYRLDEDGQIVWRTPHRAVGPLASDGQSLYVRTDDGGVRRFAAETGSEVWHYPLGLTAGTEPVIADGQVILGTTHSILALNQQTGQPLWQVELGPSVSQVGNLAATADRVITAANDGTVLAIGREGKILWRSRLGEGGDGQWLSPLVMAGDWLIGQANSKDQSILDARTGQMVTTGPILGESWRPVAITAFGLVATKGTQAKLFTSTTWREPTLPLLGGAAPLDPVLIIPGFLGSWPVGGQWQIDPYFRTYDQLLATMRLAGYVDNVTLFTFGYDWHQSTQSTSQLLSDRLTEIISRTGAQKIDIVAHSLGGLIASHYIAGTGYRDDVDQLITLGTPFRGAVPAYLAWEGGTLGSGLRSRFAEVLLRYEAVRAGYGTQIVGYIHDRLPAVQALLPIFDYLARGQILLGYWPCQLQNYPCNTFLESLAPRYELVNQRTHFTAIVGRLTGQDTPSQLTVESARSFWPWLHGKPLETLTTNGDGTVTEVSASLAGASQVVIATNHIDLPSAGSSKVVQLLTQQQVTPSPVAKVAQVALFTLDPPAPLTVAGVSGDDYVVIPDPTPTTYYVRASDGQPHNLTIHSIGGDTSQAIVTPLPARTTDHAIELRPQDLAPLPCISGTPTVWLSPTQ